jgi:hypothetical protein
MPQPMKKQTDMMSLVVSVATLLVSADVLLFHMAMTAVRPKLQSVADSVAARRRQGINKLLRRSY